MANLEKFTLKSLTRAVSKDPIAARRAKLVAAIETQKLVLAAATKGEAFTGPPKGDEAGKVVRPWFVSQDGGWYVQCRYGARPLLIDGKNNAVFVQKQAEISGVLAALVAATAAGELDAAMAAVTLRKRKQAQP